MFILCLFVGWHAICRSDLRGTEVPLAALNWGETPWSATALPQLAPEQSLWPGESQCEEEKIFPLV